MAKNGKIPGCSFVCSMAFIGSLCLRTAFAAAPAEPEFDFFIGDRVVYDDNLFRLPGGVEPLGLPAEADFRRGDYLNRVSAGVDGRWVWRRQSFDLDLVASDNRFSRNGYLDHAAGNGRALWNWRTAGDVSGRLGAEYSKALASFANSRVYVRDLLDTFSYYVDARFGIGARWALVTGGRRTEITHGADIREQDDYEGTTGSAGIEYRSPSAVVAGFDYAHTGARFPERQFFEGALLERDYEENTATFRIRYPVTDKTVLEARGGWIERQHDNETVGDFSGDVWRLSVFWQPGAKTQVGLSAWRELEAYADTESDYFETTGVSLTPLWSPTDKFKVRLAFSWEEQDYLGSNPLFADSVARNDDVSSSEVEVQYLPRSMIELALGYRHEQRGSNRPAYEFDDNVGSLSLRFVF